MNRLFHPLLSSLAFATLLATAGCAVTQTAPIRQGPPMAGAGAPDAAGAAVDRLAFERSDNGLPRRGQWRHGFAVADMNGDGHPDIVTTPPRKGPFRPFVFLGDGQGNWRPWQEARWPRLAYDYGSAAVADFDGDGRPDIALAMHLKGMLVLRQSAPGEFTPWSDAGAFGGLGSRALAALDLDGDGRPDLIALGEGPRLALTPADRGQRPPAFGLGAFVNEGGGRWRAVGVEGSQKLFGDALASADFNGDGRPDFVTSSGRLGDTGLLHLSTATGWQTQALPVVPGTAVRGVAAGDFDGDGRPDIALGLRETTTGDSVVEILFNTASGFERRTLARAAAPAAGFHTLAAADLDGDGRADLLASQDDGSLALWLGNGDRTLSPQPIAGIAPLGPGCGGYFTAFADLDGDGRPELLAAFAGEGAGAGEPACPGHGALVALRARPH